MTRLKKYTAVIGASALLVTGIGAPAALAQPVAQDGLVNVAVGDVTVLQDVNVGVAAAVAAQLCGISVGPVAVLGRAVAVDRSGVTRTVCTSDEGPVTITQN